MYDLETLFTRASGRADRVQCPCGCKLFVIFADQVTGARWTECGTCEQETEDA